MTKIKVSNRKLFTPEGSPNLDDSSGGDRDRNQTLKHRTFSKPGRNDEYVDSQFQQPPIRIPKKSILLATFLFVFGTILLVLAALSILDNDPDTLYMDRVVPLLILGTLLFIPGFYHVRIAYLCWMGVAGYNFDDIPEFE